MATIEEINKLKKTLQDLYDQMGRKNPINVENIKDAERAASVLRNAISKARELYVDSSRDLGSISSALQANVQEITRGNQGLLIARRSYRSISETINKILADQEGISELSSRQIENLQSKLSLDTQRLKISKDLLEARQSESLSILNSQEASSKEREKARKDFVESQKAINQINNELSDQDSNLNIIVSTLEKRLDLEKRIQKRIGLSGSIMKGLSNTLKKIGFEGFDDIIENTIAKQRELARISIENRKELKKSIGESIKGSFSEVNFSGGNIKSVAGSIFKGTGNLLKNAFTGSLKVLKSGLGSTFKIFGTGLVGVGKVAFRGLTSVLTIAVKLATELFKALKGVDEQAGKTAKTFNVTYEEALKIRRELVASADASGKLFINSEALLKTLESLNLRAGTRSFIAFQGELQNSINFLTQLREQAGLTDKQLRRISDISFTFDQDVKDLTGNLLGAVQAFAALQDVTLNEKQIFEEISELSAATLLSLSQTPNELSKAFVESKLLGSSLSQVEKISSGLVDFQSSIRKEIEAIVISGKDLNLNAARFYALNNDTAGVAREISKQVGSAAEFAEMNRIAQNSIAEALGFSRDELAEALIIQESISTLQGEEAKQAAAAIRARKEQIGIDRTIKELSDGQLQNIMGQYSTQEAFTASVAKMKELFVEIAPIIADFARALMPILEGFVNFTRDLTKLSRFFSASDIGNIERIAAFSPEIAKKRALEELESIQFKLQSGDITDQAKQNLIETKNYIEERFEVAKEIIKDQPIINNTSTSTTSNVISEAVQSNKDLIAAIEDLKKSNKEDATLIAKTKTRLQVGATDFGTQLGVNSYSIQYG